MLYVDYEYYVSGYLLGRSPAVPEDSFAYFEKQAERILNQHTFSRLVADCKLITDDVRDCTCELAELLYQADQVAQQSVEQGGVLQSYSNDGESGLSTCLSPFTRSPERRKKPGRSSTGAWEIRDCCTEGCKYESELCTYHYAVSSG